MSIYPHPYSKTLAFFNMDQEEILDAIHLLRQDFASGYLQINQNEASTDSWTYQKLEQLQLNTLAKRMLKKGEKFGIICQKSNHEEIVPFVLEILGKKVDEETGARLLLLSDKLQAKNQLISFGIFVENTLLGGMLFAKNESQIYYLLGACKEEARKNGGMYLAMNQALNEATKEQKTVHFGGSNISGIRSFYKAFGGIDHYYRVETWDKGPLWLKSLKRLKKMLK